jgi:hypothetical protein
MCDKQNIEHTLKREITSIVKLIIAQNYFKFGEKTYLRKIGLAMGAPTSSILSEIYMQYLENTTIYDILRDFKIEGYFRYVDNILVVYKGNTTNIKKVLNSFNNINPELKFSMEQEKDNKLNFLDITITKDANKLTYEVYRKPTTSDTIIHKDSCQPIEHKLAAVRYFANRIHMYNLDQIQKQKEIDTIKEIIYNNKYNKSILSKVRIRKKHKMTPDKDEQNQS